MSQATKAVRRSRRQGVLRRLVELKGETLQMYRPLPVAERFHRSLAKTRVAFGSNRSGKTEAGCVDLATACAAAIPTTSSLRRGFFWLCRRTWIILVRCGETYQPGEIKKIRDEITRQWRAVRYDKNDPNKLDPYDEAYREKWQDAPPIIPSRAYQTPSWENAGREIPRYVRFHNGSRMLFRSSEGKPQKGEHYNAVMFDEQLHNEQFYIEAIRGAVGLAESAKHLPRIWWNATPQITNLQLQELVEAAETGERNVDAFLFLIWQNPYIPEDEKQTFYNALSEDERLTRWEGKFALTGRRVYPTFNIYGVHGCEPFAIEPNWARYFIVDPGTRYCATLFLAVDPDEQHIWAYDEEVINSSNLSLWAAKVKERQMDYAFEAAVIDSRAGKQHQMGLSTKSTAEEYFGALREAGVTVRTLGPLGGFFPGNPDIQAREASVRRSLEIRGTGPFEGRPHLQVMRSCCPKLEEQFKWAHYDMKTNKRSAKVPQDVITTLEYGIAHRPGYHEPRLPTSVVAASSQRYESMSDLMERRNRKQRRSVSHSYGSEMEIT